MSISTECRWLKVPRRLSCPLKRMGTPSSGERAERQRFGHAEIQRTLAISHLTPLLQQLLHLGMDVEVFGILHQTVGDFVQCVPAASRYRLHTRACTGRHEKAPSSWAAGA